MSKSNRDRDAKDTKNLEKQLKAFFRANKGGGPGFKLPEDYVLTPETEKEIGPENPIIQRAKAIKDFSEVLLNHRFDEVSVKKMWHCVKDLLQDSVPKEHRHVAFHFLSCLVKSQIDKERDGLMKLHYFMLVKNHTNPEDVSPRLDLLINLVDGGRNIECLEEEIAQFLLEFLQKIIWVDREMDYLNVVINLIKYNAAYIDEEILHEYVKNISKLAMVCPVPEVVQTCLQLLDTIVCYSTLPRKSLPIYISCLCRCANKDLYCKLTLKYMRNLLGTHLGHAGIYIMVRLLQDPENENDSQLLRGAVFHLIMALWSAQRIEKLKCPNTAILPSFLSAVNTDHPKVVYEVVQGLQRLVTKYGLQLCDPTWAIVMAIIEAIIEHIAKYPDDEVTPHTTNHLHEILCTIEQLVELGQFNGCVRTIFQIIEKCSHFRPDSSVIRVITYLSRSILPTQSDWLTKLHALLDRYLHQETQTVIRIKALDVLFTVFENNRYFYEEELVECVLLPHMELIPEDPDVNVRSHAVSLVIDSCLTVPSDCKQFLDLLDVLDKVLMRGFESESQNSLTDVEAADVVTVVDGVVKIFTTWMFSLPSAHAVKAYHMLINFIEQHYTKPHVFFNIPSIRLKILECFLRLRVDDKYRLGYPTPSGLRFSLYLYVEHGKVPRTPPAPASPGASALPDPEITLLSLNEACYAIVTCLRKELDWKVMNIILQGVMQVIKNKALILSNSIDSLSNTLCSMVTDRSMLLPEKLQNTPPKFYRSDFQAVIFPIVAALASYHSQLEPMLQQRIIKCLEIGLASRSAKQCVMALTCCTLEMRDAMVKLLPEVILNLSKISATVHVAIPILEFLSTLTRLPRVYANFVVDQYMSVFAITLPYTSPFKYNHYTVSLAHHVIAVWFLKCRLPFRRDFVSFITAGLKSNMLIPFGQTQFKKPKDLINEDSSNRKRSSSLTEQGSRRRPQQAASNQQAASILFDLRPPIDETLMNFHKELMETCIDLLARYTFSTCAALPTRSPLAQSILNDSQSSTWLMGNRLITITTSGCTQKTFKSDLCDRCLVTCRLEKDLPSPSVDLADVEKTQGLHKTLSRSGSIEMSGAGSGEECRKSEQSLYDPDTMKNDQFYYGVVREEQSLCSCWCQGWAEIYVRRPTGDVSWAMRLMNEPHTQELWSLADLMSMFQPSLEDQKDSVPDSDSEVKFNLARGSERSKSDPVSIPGSPVRHSSHDSVDNLGDDDYDGGSGRSRNPVRRSNSSPEMSASWKNPFMSSGNQSEESSREVSSTTVETKKKQTHTKDLRVGCEAIPEEMGTTPPKTEQTLPITKAVPTSTSTLTQAVDHRKISAPAAVTQDLTKTGESQQGAREQKPEAAKVKEGERGTKTVTTTPPSHLASKPPLSPPTSQMSPRLQPKLVKDGEPRPDPSGLPPLAFKRDRGHTISVMSPIHKPPVDLLRRNIPNQRINQIPKELRAGISPSFVFLQMFHQPYFGDSPEKPLLLPDSQMVQRAFKNLDRIPPYETHKVGVLYVGPGQANDEVEILRNQYGSQRYTEFLRRLGSLIKLSDVDPQSVFLGGLETSGNDGKFAYIWKDDMTQVIYHIATLMPTDIKKDPNCNAKKLHIGNDFVTIVYNESGEPYNRNTVKCQFNYTCVVVEPLEHGINMLTVKSKEELAQHIGHAETKIVSDQNVALMARQIALHANLASRVAASLSQNKSDPYTSNWLERLRQIKRIRSKVLHDLAMAAKKAEEEEEKEPVLPEGFKVSIENFTKYV